MTPTLLLLVLLLAATLLGVGMGCCVVYLRMTRTRTPSDDMLQVEDTVTRTALDVPAAADAELSADDELAARIAPPDGLSAEDVLIDAHDRAEKLLEQNEALLLLSRDQSRRIDLLESEVGGLEEQRMALQRDLSGNRAGAVALRSVGDGAAPPARASGERGEVPVLNRRVARRGRRPAIKQAAGTAALDSILDIDYPALPESALPSRSDDTLELFDMALPAARRDD